MSTETINVVSNESPEALATARGDAAFGAVASTSEAAPAKATAQAETKDESEPSEQEQEGTRDKEEAGEQEEEANDKPDKPKGGFQRKIDKLTKRSKENEQRALTAEQRAAQLEARLAELERGAKPGQKQEEATKPVATAGTGEPQPEDFGTHQEYVKALVKWDRENAEREAKEQAEAKRREDAKKAEQERRQGVLAKYNESIEAAQEKYDDYDQVVDSIGSLYVPPHIVELLYEAQDSAGELTYALAKNKAELERISKLPAAQAARELGKFEAKYLKAAEAARDAEESEDDEAPEPKKITKAPEPIKPVGGSGRSQVEKSIYDESLSQADFEALERKRLAKKRA